MVQAEAEVEALIVEDEVMETQEDYDVDQV
jgi:hypothetical protein